MVDRDGKQVLLCTWSRRSPTLDFDFQFLEDPENTEKPQVRRVSYMICNAQLRTKDMLGQNISHHQIISKSLIHCS